MPRQMLLELTFTSFNDGYFAFSSGAGKYGLLKLIGGLAKYEVREGEQYGKPIKLERATFRSIGCVRCLDKQVLSHVSDDSDSINNTRGTAAAHVTTTPTAAQLTTTDAQLTTTAAYASTVKKRGRPKKDSLVAQIAADAAYKQKVALVIPFVSLFYGELGLAIKKTVAIHPANKEQGVVFATTSWALKEDKHYVLAGRLMGRIRVIDCEELTEHMGLMKLIAGLMKYEVREGEQYGKPIKLERATFRSIDCVRCLDKQVFSYVSVQVVDISTDHDSDNPIRHIAINATGSVVVSVNEEGDPTIWNVTLELSTSIIDDSDSINNTPGTAAAQVTTTATTVNASTAKKRDYHYCCKCFYTKKGGRPNKDSSVAHIAADAEYKQKVAFVVS
uniref:Uncharacterized protein n=1 Tax=Brassica campestris TaxID=3711 RepID=M4DN09_BRACM